jgi:hypothetical protein
MLKEYTIIFPRNKIRLSSVNWVEMRGTPLVGDVFSKNRILNP